MTFQSLLKRVAIGLVLTGCAFRWGYVELRYLELQIRASFAVGQTSIIEEILENAGLSRDDKVKGIGEYYPSGTKQVTGSWLDRLVESNRRLAIRLVDCPPAALPESLPRE